MGKFLIEGDWYIVADADSWNLCRMKKGGKQSKKDKEWAEITYHFSPEEALSRYLRIRQAEAVRNASDGTIKDMVDILVTENERLRAVLETAFSAITSAERKKQT